MGTREEASNKGSQTYYDIKASHHDYQVGDKVIYFRFAKQAEISQASQQLTQLVPVHTRGTWVNAIRKCQKSDRNNCNLGKTLQGMILTVTLHSALLHNTLHVLETSCEGIVIYVQGLRTGLNAGPH